MVTMNNFKDFRVLTSEGIFNISEDINEANYLLVNQLIAFMEYLSKEYSLSQTQAMLLAAAVLGSLSQSIDMSPQLKEGLKDAARDIKKK
jgi:hypothetical protein